MVELISVSHGPIQSPLSSNAALTEDNRDEVDSALFESSQKQLRKWSVLRKRLTDVNAYRKKHTDLDESLLSIIEEKDQVSFPEERIIAYASQYLLEGANIECSDVHGNTPLHKAASMGFPDLTKELLQRGANVHALNYDGQTPMEIAINKGLALDDERTEDYSRVAALVIKEMEPLKVRETFLSSPTKVCKLKFCQLLGSKDMQEATDAVLDALIEKIHVPQSKKAIKVHYSLLEANVQLENFHRGSNFKYIVNKNNKDVIIHPAVMLLIESKWRRFARSKLILNFIYWVVTITVMLTALILGAQSREPTVYNTPKDYFRVVCEALMVLLITISAIRDLVLISVVKRRFFTEYKFFIFNYFDILTAVLLYVYIILHAFARQERLVIASIIFVSYALRGFRFLLTIRSISNYVIILVRILRHDIFTFLVVFAVVLLATSGGVYLESKVESDDGHGMNATESSDLDMSLPQFALAGIRMMVEGDKIINYTTFRWFGYSAYLVFMFFVVVVLQSLLIAQMSDTFTNVQTDAKRVHILNKARSILNIEETTNSLRLPWTSKLFKLARIKTTVLTEEVWDNPDKYLKEVELPESVIYTRKLIKLEKMMATQRELVEELRDSMMENKKLTTSLKLMTGN